MQSYEVVREVENLCANNQMRDIFFEEIETDDPVGWLRDFVKGKDVELTVDEKESGDLTVFVESGGVTQKFLFTRHDNRCAASLQHHCVLFLMVVRYIGARHHDARQRGRGRAGTASRICRRSW